MPINVPPAGRNNSARGITTSTLPGNSPSHAASSTRGQGQGTGGSIPPIPVDVSQQPVVSPGSRRATPPAPLRRRRGSRGGDETTNSQNPLVVRTTDPHTEATLAQFHMQGVSALQGPAHDAKEGSGKVVDWFMQLLGITGTPR